MIGASVCEGVILKRNLRDLVGDMNEYFKEFFDENGSSLDFITVHLINM